MKIIRAGKRHFVDLGWLKARWLFSFDSYYDPDNLQLGSLRVFNDDIVEAGEGFDMHGHREMEIVTIILSGEITHQDSMGNKTALKAGDIQRMSAGTGVRHSEHNLGSESLNLYQIWIQPRTPEADPSYQQANLKDVMRKNELVPVVSGLIEGAPLYFDSDATIFMAELEPGCSVEYQIAEGRHGFLYLTEGELSINGKTLRAKDQVRISEPALIAITALKRTKCVLIDVK